jgi:hypothetical protein
MESASATGHHATLTAFEDVKRHSITTLFTAMASLESSPLSVGMITLMVVPKLLHQMSNSTTTGSSSRRLIANYAVILDDLVFKICILVGIFIVSAIFLELFTIVDFFCTLIELTLVPLWTTTTLPAHNTQVTKLPQRRLYAVSGFLVHNGADLRHVVAALSELNRCGTSLTLSPSFSGRCPLEELQCLVLGTHSEVNVSLALGRTRVATASVRWDVEVVGDG